MLYSMLLAFNQDQEGIEQDMRERAQFKVSDLARHAERLLHDRPEVMEEDINLSAADETLKSAVLIDTQGVILYSNIIPWRHQKAGAVLSSVELSLLEQAVLTRTPQIGYDAVNGHMFIAMSYAAPGVNLSSRSQGMGLIALEYDLRSALAEAYGIGMRESLPEFVVLCVGALFLMWVLHRLVTAPLRRIGAAGHEMAAGQFQSLDSKAMVNEVRQLADTFNFMSRQLATKVEQMASQARQTQAILDNAAYAIIATTAEGHITVFNRAAERMLGYSAEEMVGHPNLTLIHDATEVATRARQLRSEFGMEAATGFDVFVERSRRGLSNESEWIYVRKDGTRFPVLLSASALRDSNGHVAGFLGIAQDITEHKKAELALHQKQRLIDSVIENIPSMIFMKRVQDMSFVLLNKAGEKLLGVKREDLIGKSDHDLFPQAQADAFVAKDRETLECGFQDIPAEPVHTREHGERILHTRKIALRDSAGEAQYLLCISDDITESRRAELALLENSQHTQAILDNVVDGIITIDEHGIVASFNKSAEHIFGYKMAEVIGHNVSMLMPNPYREEHDGYLANYHGSGVARIIGTGREVEGQRKDGSVFPLDLAISEISRNAESMYIGITRDITERKRMERMKEEFVSTVSHELRTPLTSISGALGLLTGGAVGVVPEHVLSLINIAHDNSQRLTLLINDLLDMEKIAAGKMRFDMQAQQLMPLVEQALDANKMFGVQANVNIRIIERIEGVEVRVDDQRLMQVFSNFLSNAIKFSPKGGEVWVAARHLGGRVRISVGDHGLGIPPEFHQRIFQKFSQADSSDTRQKGGTGLGLAISKELIERMGGRIGFDSVPGQGATFYIELPILRRGDDTSDKLVEELDSDAPRILVVEDDPDIAHLIAMMLQRAGYNADIATDGEQALRQLEQSKYAAMTLDLILPDINGLDIIRRVRSQAALAHLPIVVVSAKMEEGRLAISGDFSAIDWLPKPVQEDSLLETVMRVLPQDQAQPPRVLHVEDDRDLQKVIRRMAGKRFEFDSANSLEEAVAMLAQRRYDVVMLDIGLPDGSGWALLPRLRALEPPPRVIILSSAELSVEEAAKVEGVLLKTRVSTHQLLSALDQRINAKIKTGENI